MARFVKTPDITRMNDAERAALQPGQWVYNGAFGHVVKGKDLSLGRFYGVGRGGTVVVAWAGNWQGRFRAYCEAIKQYARSIR